MYSFLHICSYLIYVATLKTLMSKWSSLAHHFTLYTWPRVYVSAICKNETQKTYTVVLQPALLRSIPGKRLCKFPVVSNSYIFCEFVFLPGDEICVTVRVDNLSGSSAWVKVFARMRYEFQITEDTKRSVVSNTASCESMFHQLAFN